MIEDYIKKLKPYVTEYFKDDFTGHDIGHLERTLSNALYICKKEGGNEIIVGISAYLHDIHRIMQNERGHFVSPEESLDIVREMLSHLEISEKDKEEICYCIKHHEEYNWNGNNVSNKNALILQDADNLAAIGAIGKARAFSFGGTHKIKMYDKEEPLDERENYIESMGSKESTIHHFYHKLFKLGNNMNTKTAKKIANKRIKFMKKFTNEFLNEWNAKY